MEVKYSIFVSSAYTSLKKVRGETISAILKLGCFPIAMGYFSASQFSDVEKALDLSDAVILLLGKEYGSRNEDGISWTELEYIYAIEHNIHIFCLELPGLTKLKNQEINKLSEDEKSQLSFASRIEKDQNYLCPIKKDNEIYEKISTHFLNAVKSESFTSGWERRIDENKWRTNNKAFYFGGTWYTFHVSKHDKNYLRIGEATIDQIFDSRNYKELNLKAFNEDALYDSKTGMVESYERKRTTWSADYEIYQHNGIIEILVGIYSSTRNFTSEFADAIKIDANGLVGIHRYDNFRKNANGEITSFSGTFRDTCVERSGEIFMFREKEERDNYIKKYYKDVLDNNIKS